MAINTWRGGTGLFDDGGNWSTGTPPAAGDLAVVAAGVVIALSERIGATIDLGGLNAAAPPTLVLVDGSTGLTMPAPLPPPLTAPGPVQIATAPEYATVDAVGQDALGTVSIGAYNEAGQSPFGGHPAQYAQDHLTVNLLGAGTTLSAGLTVLYGSTLTINGGWTTGLASSTVTVGGGTAIINAPLLGTGRIDLVSGPVNHFGEGTGATVTILSKVGTGETIGLGLGTLRLDAPAEFKGAIDLHQSPGPFAAGGFPGETLDLVGLSATSWAIGQATGDLTLFFGSHIVDTVRLVGTVPADFTPPNHGTPQFWVLQAHGEVVVSSAYYPGEPGFVALPQHS